jgi:hypothetical protein
MIDVDRVLKYMRALRSNRTRIAERSGLSYGHVRETFQKKRDWVSYALTAATLDEINVPLDAIDPEREPTWLAVHLSDVRRTQQFHELWKDAQAVLTVSRGIDSYLLENSMLQLPNQLATPIADWKQYETFFLPYVAEQRAARSASNFHHRFVVDERLLDNALCKSVDWLDEFRNQLITLREETALAVAGNWRGIEREIAKLLPPFVKGWTKICIVDDLAVMIHLNHEQLLLCMHPTVVQEFARSAERAFRPRLKSSLPGSNAGLQAFEDGTWSTIDLIEKMLLTQHERVYEMRRRRARKPR